MFHKRVISIFLPIRVYGGEMSVFLQKRSEDMQVLPNHFGFWGGGCEEGETSEQGLIREVKDELGIDLDMSAVERFNHYEFLESIKNVFIYTPEGAWETNLIVGEGDYGKWFTITEALDRDDIILEDKVVLNDLERRILKKKIK